jgi:DNA polymerase-4
MIGKNGIDIWKKTNGIDNNPVDLIRNENQFRQHTFDQDTIDIQKLKSVLRMVEKLTFQLRSEEWLTSTVVIKIRYPILTLKPKQCKVAYTSADHILTKYELVCCTSAGCDSAD